MFAVRISAVGGIFLLMATTQAAPFPVLPRKVYLLILKHATFKQVGMHKVVIPATSSTTPDPLGPIQPAPKPQKSKVSSSMDWLDDNLFGKLEVTGSRTLGLHAFSVTGDKDAYATTTNYGEGDQTFTNNGSMSVAGRKVFGVLSFQADLPDSRLSDPTTHQVLLEYDRGPLKVSEGDIRGSLLSGNSLTNFYKSLKGSMVEYTKGPLHAKALYSETKGSAQTVSIQGSNSVGPYYLESGRVLQDTLQVQVDGQTMRPGTDYVLDTNLGSGSISFLSRVIPPTSTIVATFESVSPGTSPGILAGVGASYNLGRFGQVGASIVQQRSTGTSGDGTVPDLFVFAGATSTTYMLSYEPIVSTITVQLGDRLLVMGTYVNGVVVGDYALNPAEHRQLILNSTLAAPDNTTLYVKYRPQVTQSVNGDRQVYGFDYSYRFGQRGGIQFNQALGQTINTADSTGALARTLNGNYLIGDLNLTANVKDIPTHFVSIETEGFSRNERSYSLGAEVKKPLITYGIAYGNSMIDDQSTSTTSTTLYNARSTSAKAYATYNSADGTNWTVAQTRTSGHQAYESQLDSSSLSAAKSFGKQVRFDTGVEYQQGRGPLLDSAGNTVIGSVELVTYHVGATYTPITHLNLVGKVSVSDTRALGQASTGDDISFSSTWRPSDKWGVSASLLNSTSGQGTTLSGFSNGAGYGYGGNGFSSGGLGSGYLGAANGQLNTRTMMLDYKASNRLPLNLHYTENRSTGTLSSNSLVKSIGVGGQWDLGQVTVLDVSLDRTTSDFINSAISGSTNTTSVGFNLTGSPKGKWSYQLGLNTLVSGGTSIYRQNSLDYNLEVGYRLAPKHQLSASYIRGDYTGYSGQEDDQFIFSYTYSIFSRLGLTGSYRIHNVSNLDPTVTTGAYRANAFDLSLSYGFRS